MINLKSNSDLRYKRFIETVKDTQIVWDLKSDSGWAICESTEYEDCQVIR